MSDIEDWPPIDELFRKLAGLLRSARQARDSLQISIDAGQLHIARYPSFGDVTRWEQISACDAGWWRGRRLITDGDILRLTEQDGVTEDCEWMIVVSHEDVAALWPGLAPSLGLLDNASKSPKAKAKWQRDQWQTVFARLYPDGAGATSTAEVLRRLGQEPERKTLTPLSRDTLARMLGRR